MPGRITPEAFAAYRARDWLGLHRALHLRPWECSPIDAASDDPPEWAGNMWRASWARARELRRQLEAGEAALIGLK